jgi:hypothetical protein
MLRTSCWPEERSPKNGRPAQRSMAETFVPGSPHNPRESQELSGLV